MLIALLAIPFLILFLSLNERAQKKVRRPVASQQAPYQKVVTQNTIPVSGTPDTPQNRAFEKIANRIPLSQNDFYAKNRILDFLPQNEESGPVYTSERVTVEYIASADTFQAEILTKDTTSAKEEASVWFQSQGMSEEGVCNVPLTFYLNYNIKSELGPDASSFNPLPEGC